MALARVRSLLTEPRRGPQAPAAAAMAHAADASRGEQGFGLVESLLSVGIASAGLLAVAGLLATGARLQRNSRDGGRAGMAAMQQLEVLRMLPTNDPRVQTAGGGAPAGSLTANVANYNALLTVAPAGQTRVRWGVQRGPANTLDITVRAEPVVAGGRPSTVRSLVWR